MSEKNDPAPETEPVRPEASEESGASKPPEAPEEPTTPEQSESAAPEAPAPEAPAKRRFRDRFSGAGQRLNGTRGLIAATLAALIVGGLGGAAIHAAVDDDGHEHGRFFRGDRPGDPDRDFGGRMGGGERPGR